MLSLIGFPGAAKNVPHPIRKGDMKEFDHESLSGFDGKGGQDAYIAVDGKVIDVSASRLWKAGVHMNRHQAGGNLTSAIGAAPHGPEVLDQFPQVGIFKQQEGSAVFLPKWLETLLEHIPFLRRHPHPMLVHFPVVFMISPAVFYLLYLITGINSFENTALHCLGGGILFSVPGILSGFFTWWINYQAKSSRPVTIKIYLSILLVIVSVAAFNLRVFCPFPFPSLSKEGFFYLLLLLALVPIVSIIGWYGASLTFPLERK